MSTGTASTEVTYLEAISQALDEEMTRDERVFLMGEDIGTYGGAFKITEGFIEKYGEWRVLDAPLSESGFVGAAIGAAMMGLRPVVEMQFADFISCAFDQITEVAAKNHYRWGAPVPMVIRAPFGGGVHGGPFHSECPEGWFFHSPGLKLVAPSTPYDAKGLLKAAIRDPNPVIYFEHKFLYRRIKEVLPREDYIVPIGQAAIRRPGNDISVITYGAMVHLALEAAQQLAAEGIDIEVVDLRSLMPLDKDTIYGSVRKTGKAIMVHEDNKTGGIGAELAALLAEDCFDSLDGPILRVAAPDTPVPFSTPLEEFFLPKTSDIVAAARKLAAY
ncbi:alpha-ketoacid dehydrogenase subunit beta [Candidatus Nitrospira inopinata]|jgi:2-oxoisovalerate dehydrogenase E1 component beta subunit|uniref:Putative Pyruvate dehydrogenase E1 component, subunit beta n=1 Tax=Candidatus Nitrospira inopinata TaxID=1715989 RepID=A0A0S4KN95_9BACT|nr:alpha-ketoacid dehydrogenase subunit beta [Candidatus Nitrospira inopinata]CUQ65923.1 putative Pyruvate dehydrogenase E1 component, subunit beta [Candidatus Nitrospira inopinata]